MVERSELAPSARFAALVSRQYAEMSRIRIEGLLAAFPKLVGTGKQHTYVETENVRYVYQPIEVSGQWRPQWPEGGSTGRSEAPWRVGAQSAARTRSGATRAATKRAPRAL